MPDSALLYRVQELEAAAADAERNGGWTELQQQLLHEDEQHDTKSRELLGTIGILQAQVAEMEHTREVAKGSELTIPQAHAQASSVTVAELGPGLESYLRTLSVHMKEQVGAVLAIPEVQELAEARSACSFAQQAQQEAEAETQTLRLQLVDAVERANALSDGSKPVSCSSGDQRRRRRRAQAEAALEELHHLRAVQVDTRLLAFAMAQDFMKLSRRMEKYLLRGLQSMDVRFTAAAATEDRGSDDVAVENLHGSVLHFTSATVVGLRHTGPEIKDRVLRLACNWGHGETVARWQGSSTEWKKGISLPLPTAAEFPIAVFVTIADSGPSAEERFCAGGSFEMSGIGEGSIRGLDLQPQGTLTLSYMGEDWVRTQDRCLSPMVEAAVESTSDNFGIQNRSDGTRCARRKRPPAKNSTPSNSTTPKGKVWESPQVFHRLSKQSPAHKYGGRHELDDKKRLRIELQQVRAQAAENEHKARCWASKHQKELSDNDRLQAQVDELEGELATLRLKIRRSASTSYAARSFLHDGISAISNGSSGSATKSRAGRPLAQTHSVEKVHKKTGRATRIREQGRDDPNIGAEPKTIRIRLTGLDKKARRSLFKQWDVNGNGALSLAEIDKAMVESFPEYNHKPALMRAYKAVARDGNGFVTRREFGKLLHFVAYFADVWAKFEEIDTDGDQRLTLSEFGHASEIVGVKLTSGELQAEFGRLNDGGLVLFQKFCCWCAHRHLGAGFRNSDENDVDTSVRDFYSAEFDRMPGGRTEPSTSVKRMAENSPCNNRQTSVGAGSAKSAAKNYKSM
jgi:Ca2+-binding EF-hand superfamily protein